MLGEEVRGADGEVRVRAVAEHRREAAAEHRHERDADQEQADPHRPRDLGDAGPGGRGPRVGGRFGARAPEGEHRQHDSGGEHDGEVHFERDAGVAEQRQLQPARARADRQHPQQLVPPQPVGQPQPHDPEAGDGEERERGEAGAQRVVDRADAGHPGGVGDVQRGEGAEREEEDGPQAVCASPLLRARWTRCTNTGLPRR
jgi:hypothetical protein